MERLSVGPKRDVNFRSFRRTCLGQLSAVNPSNFKVRSGALKDFIPITFPAILGVDLSGLVAAVGSGVTKFKPGDKVFANASQTYASLCVVKEADLAPVPGSAPLIFDKVLREGDRQHENAALVYWIV